MKPQDLITNLRDIHQPPAIPFWPLAPGWYFLFALIIIALTVSGYCFYKKWLAHAVKRLVLERIDELEKRQKAESFSAKTSTISEELSALLKRAALARYPRRQVAGLHAESWLLFLDRTGQTTEFSQGIGKLLTVYPYRSQSEILPEQFFHLIKNWVEKNL